MCDSVRVGIPIVNEIDTHDGNDESVIEWIIASLSWSHGDSGGDFVTERKTCLVVLSGDKNGRLFVVVDVEPIENNNEEGDVC